MLSSSAPPSSSDVREMWIGARMCESSTAGDAVWLAYAGCSLSSVAADLELLPWRTSSDGDSTRPLSERVAGQALRVI